MKDSLKIEKKEKSLNLRSQLTRSFLLLTFLTLFVATGLGLYFNFQSEKDLIFNQQELIARGAANTVKDFINQKFRLLEQASDVNNLASNPDRRYLVMNKLMGRDSSFNKLFLIDLEGKSLEQISRLSTEITDPLEKYKKSILSNASIGKEYISPVYIDTNTGEPLILIAVPTKNILKEYKGAFVAETNLKFMWDLVSGIKVGDNGVAYVVDKKGDLIAFVDSSRVLKGENLSSLVEVGEFEKNENLLDQDFSLLSIVKGIYGTNVISTYSSLGMPDWAVVVELPAMEAYMSLIQLLGWSLFIIIFSFALATIVSIYLSKSITKPVISLRDAALEITAGKLNTRINIESKDEIGQLAKSFNIMTEKLQGVYLGLEQKVEKKTGELVSKIEELENAKKATANLLEDLEEEKSNVENKIIERTRELKEEKARLVASINSLNIGFIVADLNNNIILSNKAMFTLLDLDVDTKINIDEISNILGGLVSIKIEIQNCLKNKKMIEIGEINFNKKIARGIISPIITTQKNQKEIIGYILLLEDITEAKIMERSRDEFFAVASHELRTPLTAIRGNTDMILDMYSDKIVDKDVKEMLCDINEASVRLIGIVNDFLDVSRLEQGKISINNTKFDLTEIIEKIIGILKNGAEEKNLFLKFEKDRQVPVMVFADKDKTEQILLNLIGNAIKFTTKGGITIAIEISQNFVKIGIADTGSGISTENEKLLFRKFQPAGSQVLARDVTKSTGLGLYISRLIISKMGGTIGLEKSVVGEGSVFFFTLPLGDINQLLENVK